MKPWIGRVRLVLDTNIYISGFINRYGNPGRLLRGARRVGRFVPVTCRLPTPRPPPGIIIGPNVRAARKPVAERFKSGAAGLCDCARNDPVEATAPRGAHPPPVVWRIPVMLCALPVMPPTSPVMLRAVAASRMTAKRFKSGVPGLCDYARNDEVEVPASYHI